VGTNSNIRSIHQFIQSSPKKKALLLGQRTPEADTSLTLSQSYNPYYDDILLKVKQARDYFLLVGPPGTGKTSMALRFMVEEELKNIEITKSCHNDFSSILLMAYTNRAVDEIRSMLEDAGLADDERILVGTTSMMQARPFLLEGHHFSLAIVDEASQVLEPGLIGLLSSNQIERFVLVGDHKQLPAVVQQNPEEARVDDPLLRSIGLNDCRQSLFQRLYNWEVQQQRTQFIGTLNRQGRMHPDVASFASNHFYNAWLQPVPLPHQQETALCYDLPSQDAIDDLLKTRRMAFFPDNGETTIDLALRIRRFYGKRFNPEKTLGIIVTYRHQIAAIREALPDISIDTVERYQGSQRDVIIFDVGVTRQYQLDFLTASTFTDDEGQVVDRKLNVALTRARKQMLVVGNATILRQNQLYRQLIDNFSVKM
jgi:superfamily I DNA and/or RNA helicase